jgi:hypothetical protein
MKESDRLKDLGVDWNIILKCNWNEQAGMVWTVSCGPGLGQVADCCEHDNDCFEDKNK